MRMGISIKTTYPVSKLLEAIKENRKNHEENYKKAMEIYREEVTKFCEKQLKLAKDGKDIEYNCHLEKPVQYLKYYDQAIKMFEFSSETAIDLDSNVFSQLVCDDWEWKEQFIRNTMTYASMR